MCIHVDILLISLLLTFIGFALASYEPGSSGCKAFQHFKTWSYLPCEPKVFNADPIARVFEGQLYVYTSWDDPSACGSSWEGKKEGYQQFCMPGYRAYSTSDLELQKDWVSHGAVIREEHVPWVYNGNNGWDGAARMWAPDVVQGDDSRFYLFFPAAYQNKHNMVIGVAVSDVPEGHFKARSEPITGTVGIDPSVVKLPNGKWVLFVSGGGSEGDLFVSYLDQSFSIAGPRLLVKGLKSGYKEGPHAELRDGNLMLFYSLINEHGVYSIEQAASNHPEFPESGFWNVNTAISGFSGNTNHASTVAFNDKQWIFYHHHTEAHGDRWASRRVIFSGVSVNGWGRQSTIEPYYDDHGFNVRKHVRKIISSFISIKDHPRQCRSRSIQ